MVVATYANELSEEGFTCLAFDPGHVQTDMGGESVRSSLTHHVHSHTKTLETDRTRPTHYVSAGPLEGPREYQEHDRPDRKRLRRKR